MLLVVAFNNSPRIWFPIVSKNCGANPPIRRKWKGSIYQVEERFGAYLDLLDALFHRSIFPSNLVQLVG